jgi:hypothetical protein
MEHVHDAGGLEGTRPRRADRVRQLTVIGDSAAWIWNR